MNEHFFKNKYNLRKALNFIKYPDLFFSGGIFTPLILGPLKHVYNLAKNREYRTYSMISSRLYFIPRHTDFNIILHGRKYYIPDTLSFLSAYNDIFVQNLYKFKPQNETPKILDLGANIGLSVLYFKINYPNSKITAYEADPLMFKYLVKNVRDNGFNDVELINKAVWTDTGEVKFISKKDDSSRILSNNEDNYIMVKCENIKDILKKEQYDFLKVDIEGAENVVFPACKGYLGNIKYVFIEYHSHLSHEQSLSEIINLLTDEGYRIHIHSVNYSPSPFDNIKSHQDYDLQLNIFGKKE